VAREFLGYVSRIVRHEFRRTLVGIPTARYFLRSWGARHQRASSKASGQLSFATHVINLPHRRDRLLEVERELKSVGIDSYKIFSAVNGMDVFPQPKLLAGKRGCAQSHIDILRESRGLATPLLVVEDDLRFAVDAPTFHSLVNRFLLDSALDVFSFHYFSCHKIRVGPEFSVATDLVSAAGYLVKPTAIRSVLKDFERSARYLGRGINLPIDHAWWRTQRWSAVFAVSNIMLATQAGGDSDIDYSKRASSSS
jgi:GR25 family glycosyltransferase involved in LPS biosynthesis